MPAKKADAPRRPKKGSLEQIFSQWATLKHQGDLIAERQKDLRTDLMGLVKGGGLTDEKGSFFLNLHTPVTVGDKTYRTLKNERRVSERLDEDAAEELLKSKGLLERCQKTVVVFDPDELYVLNQEGLLSDEELDSLIVISESYAFKPLTEAVAE
jgi:hypothetical protein